ncbi:THAP domain-containing protein 11-like [Ornithodoros turicata]|uniref:THAP domain-containing protein 11-like n=1 Tax=Ornithodoros turicata TaxID=34597 RepID=UPI003139EB11
MGGFTCCVPGCYKNSTKHKGLGFYKFPVNKARRKEWIRRIGRKGNNGKYSEFVPTDGHRVCGLHFKNGAKTYMDHTPTVFPLKRSVDRVSRSTRLQKKEPQQLEPELVEDEAMNEAEERASSPDPSTEEMASYPEQGRDHNYGLPPETNDDPRTMLLRQKNIIEQLLGREEELQELLKARDVELAELRAEFHKKEGESSRRELELLVERNRNQWLQGLHQQPCLKASTRYLSRT